MKMKKIFFILAFIVIGVSFIISCQKDSTNTELKTEMINRYEIVGEKHNQYLSLVFQDIKENKLNISSKEKLNNVFKTSLAKVIDDSNFSTQFNMPKSEITEMANYNYDTQFNSKEKYSKSGSLAPMIYNSGLSDEFIDLTERLIVVTNRNELTNNEVRELIDALNDEAIITLTDEREINIYFCASSVANASFEYWENNMGQWVALFNEQKMNYNANKDSPYDNEMLDGVVSADAGGAVAGALVAAITGPVGWVAGGIIGGCAASSGAFVSNVYDFFF